VSEASKLRDVFKELSVYNFSYNLTMPILATIIKYPYSSLEGNKKMSDGGKYSQKKYGYFTSEKEDYNRIIETLGLKGKTRHPLTFLLEAADDIAYSVSDIEDGHKLGIITLDRIKRTFSTHDCPGELVGLKKYESNMDLYVRLLRIKCQSKMLIKTTKEYNRRINEIIEGDFDSEILKVSEASKLRDVFKELSVYNFSYNLTMPILATIIKYPYSSLEGNKKMSDGGKYSQKKYGYFTSEKEDYNRIIETLGLKGKTRHPLTFLLEAADDIAYSVSDIEDGHKLGIITLDRIKRTFSTHDCPGELVGLKKYESNMDLYVRLLRIKCQSKMLIKTTKEYNRRINEIIEGDFDSEILKVSEASKLRDVFKELSVYNFSNIKVLKCELLGQEVLSYLLNTFYNALFSKEICLNGKLNRKSKEFKIYSLISKNYIDKACNEGEEFPTDNYKKFMLDSYFFSPTNSPGQS
jgi:dGTP triphosphohydrolase